MPPRQRDTYRFARRNSQKRFQRSQRKGAVHFRDSIQESRRTYTQHVRCTRIEASYRKWAAKKPRPKIGGAAVTGTMALGRP